jgi:hypothetical protein
MFVLKRSCIYLILVNFLPSIGVYASSLQDLARIRLKTPFSFLPIEKPIVAQQEIDGSMCIFYALANALLAAKENSGSDFLFEVERLTSLFSHICDHQRGNSENLAVVYQKICDYGNRNLDKDCQALNKAVKEFKIISLNLANLKNEKSMLLLQKISRHKKSAIIAFVQDRDQSGGHVFSFGITNKPEGVNIRVLDSVDAKYHHEKRFLTDEEKNRESSETNYENEITFIKNFLQNLQLAPRQEQTERFDYQRAQRIQRYKDQIEQLNNQLIELKVLLRKELLASAHGR